MKKIIAPHTNLIIMMLISLVISLLLSGCSEMGSWDLMENQKVDRYKNQSMVTLSLSGSGSISENSGSETITATVSQVPESDITIDLLLSGDAVLNTDYSCSNATTMVIPAGNTTASTVITAIDDTTTEDNETVIVSITSVTNAAEDGEQAAAITITDDDFTGPAISAAEYFDTDANGRIDHLKLTLSETVNDSTFDGYTGGSSLGTVSAKWSIAGYSNVRIDTRDAIDGSGGENDTVIWIAFDEQTTSFDTDATPELTVTDASLQDLDSGNCYLNTGIASCSTQTAADIGSGDVTETDKAPPVIIDAVSDIGLNSLAVTFSEPVDSDGGACDSLLGTANVVYTNASLSDVSGITSMGTDCDACDDNSITQVLNGSTTTNDINSDTIAASTTSNPVYDSAGNTAVASSLAVSGMNDFVAYYPFNGSTNDQSGNAVNFTAGSGSFAADRDGNGSKAYSFNGSSDYLSSPDPAPLDAATELSISVWVYLANPASNQKILGKVYFDGSSLWKGYMVGVDGSQLNVELWDTGGVQYTVSGGAISANTWTHLAVTWETNGKLKAYINGTCVQTVNAGANPISTATGGTFKLGAGAWCNFFWVNGRMDDIRIYNRKLSPTEVAVLNDRPAD
ncbi:MAG: LamG domain-containing protein [bacterium]|nr:LamG domain-containing protein [bacterium]